MQTYVYAHINPNNGKVFYIGSCYSKNDRINDPKPRNNLWKEEVERIGGFDKVQKEKLIVGDYSKSKIISLEWAIGQQYYKKGENYCCLEHNVSGENNPNYGNKWTQGQKDRMSKIQTGRYVGENNPNYGNCWSDEQKEHMSKLVEEQFRNGRINGRAQRVELVLLDGNKKEFRQKKDMAEWCNDNLGFNPPENWRPGEILNRQSGKNVKFNGMIYYHI